MADFAGTVTLVRPNRWQNALYALPIAALGALGVGALAAATGHAADPDFFGAMLAIGALAGLGARLAVRFNVGASRTEAAIEVDRAGVRAAGALVAAREGIEDGYLLQQRDGTWLVRLLGKRRVPKLSIAARSKEDGEAILRALELDVLHRTLDVATIVKIDHANWPTRILVGADGVLVKLAPLGFIPYSDIERVERTETGGAIVRRSGDVVRWAAVSITSAAIRERVEEGLAAFRRAEPADPLAWVGRGGRSVHAWIEALRAAGRDRDYRGPALPDETLWRITEDPAAEPTSRAGAAVILRERGGVASKVRIAAAAAATAQPRIRVALEAAAEADDETLGDALAAVPERRSAGA